MKHVIWGLLKIETEVLPKTVRNANTVPNTTDKREARDKRIIIIRRSSLLS